MPAVVWKLVSCPHPKRNTVVEQVTGNTLFVLQVLLGPEHVLSHDTNA